MGLVLLALACLPLTSWAEQRLLTERDLFRFVWIGDPQLSPDGTRCAFVRVTVDEKTNSYHTALWAVPMSGAEPPRPLSGGEHDSAPRWSADGQYLAFLRAIEHDGKIDPPQLWILPMTGGDAFPVTTLPRAVTEPAWSPDGQSIAFLSSTNTDDLAKQQRKASGQGGQEERESDVHVITRADYRSNDEGYLDLKHPQHIWVVPAPREADTKPVARMITSGRFDEERIAWAPDGTRIYFTSDRDDEPYYRLPRTEFFAVPAAGGPTVSLTSVDMGVEALALSPDGKRLAFIAATTRPINSYSEPRLWLLDLAPGATPRNLTRSFDWDVGAAAIGDNAAPRAGGRSPPLWAADGRSIIETYTKQGRTILAQFDAASGAETDLTSGDQVVLAFRAAPGAKQLVYEVSTPTRINDLFVLDRAAPDAAPRQITDVNHELFATLKLSEPQELWFNSFDGKRIQAWIQQPPGFDAHTKYPLILNIHGGPHVAYGYVFDHEFQWMAAKGYVVLYPNPRGSTGYGEAFGNIIQYHYPGDDYKDLMAAVDTVVSRGYIAPGKLGVTGGSGGGLLTNWVVGHTTRFAAAVSQRDIADWAGWWYGSDIVFFQPNWFKGPPFEDEAEYRERSPITYIRKVVTPLMLVLGDADTRTPPASGGEQMFRALKYRRVPTVMVRFPGETHELSRSGQPWHRIERLEHIVGWFDHWLLGVPAPQYEPGQ
jgi:dipeptidyl aminopeptidase/acylaminoacyl peptidase